MSLGLLERNERELARSASADERIRLLQDRAVILARIGRLDESTRALDDARALYDDDTGRPLQMRSDYVAALQSYFHKRFQAALESLQFVLDAARAGGNAPLTAECESALALFLQREGDVRGSAWHARAVIANGEAPTEALYRAQLALASLHQDAHDPEGAMRLYEAMQPTVARLDDEVARASLLHRIATARAARARQLAAQGKLDATTLQLAVQALEESIRFAASLREMVPVGIDQLLLAEMRILQRHYDEALQLYEQYLPNAEGEGFLVEVTAALSDRAYCLLQLGRTEAAHIEIVAALARLNDGTPAEIRAIVHDNAAAVLERRGRPEEGAQHRTLARIAWEAHAHEQRETLRLLRVAEA